MQQMDVFLGYVKKLIEAPRAIEITAKDQNVMGALLTSELFALATEPLSELH